MRIAKKNLRLRKGEPLSADVVARFWEKVAVAGPDECWLWTACRDKHGYGYFGLGGGLTSKASQVSWFIANGPIPPGLVIPPRPGILNCTARVTEEEVREIRKLTPIPSEYEAVGEQFGLTRSSISKIIRQQTWKHIL